MEFTDPLRLWYEQTPYLTVPVRCSHPDNLSVEAALAGLAAPALPACRVLEIGCGSGGNLLPMAQTLPEAKLCGIDLVPRQLEAARRIASAAGLRNVEFRCEDLRDLSDTEPFDFIIAHGVYSWVEPAVRDRLLAFCGRALSPSGVAYVSYNTLPGWHVRSLARQLLRFLPPFPGATPADRAARARDLSAAVSESANMLDPNWGGILRIVDQVVKEKDDAQLLHDELEPTNDAVFFADFVAHARGHGLRYLCPADPSKEPWDRLPKAVRQSLASQTGDSIALAQLVDVVVNRSYRESILCRDDATLEVQNRADVVRSSWIASPLKPVGPGRFAMSADKIDIPDERLERTIRVLAERWPQAIHFTELLELATSPADPDRQPTENSAGDAIVTGLRALQRRGLVEFWRREPDFIGGADVDSPRTTELARRQAVAGEPVVNLRHIACGLDDELRQALAGLNETNATANSKELISILAKNSLLTSRR